MPAAAAARYAAAVSPQGPFPNRRRKPPTINSYESIIPTAEPATETQLALSPTLETPSPPALPATILQANSLRELPLTERPRERLRRYGPSLLSSAELLALLLGSTNANSAAALAQAQSLLAELQGLKGLNAAERSDLLAAAAGLRPAQSERLLAAMELGRRAHAWSAQAKAVIHAPEDAANLLGPEMAVLAQEHMKAVLLDTKNQVMRILTVYIGTTNRIQVRASEIFQQAVKDNAPQLILAHNHPSGDPTPSPEDREVTQKLRQAGETLDIEVVDHLVIGSGNRFVSMRKLRQGFDK